MHVKNNFLVHIFLTTAAPVSSMDRVVQGLPKVAEGVGP
jgi:hypothetical protein